MNGNDDDDDDDDDDGSRNYIGYGQCIAGSKITVSVII